MISMVMTAIIFTTPIIVMIIVITPPVGSSNRSGCSSSDSRSSRALSSSLPFIGMDFRIVPQQMFSARLCSSSSSSTLLSHQSLSSFSSEASSEASSPLFPSSTVHELAVVLTFSFPDLPPLSFPQARNKELQQMCDASALYVHLQADPQTADTAVPLGILLLLPPLSLSSSDAASSARLRSKGCWQIALCLLFPHWQQCSLSSQNVLTEEMEMSSNFENSIDNKCSNDGNFSLPLFLSQVPHPILIDLSSPSSAIPFIWFSRIFSKTRRNEEEQRLFNIDTKKKGGKEMWRLMFAPLSPPLSVSNIFLNRSSLLESVKWLLKDFEMQRLLDVFSGRENDSSAADARKSGGFRIIDLRVEGRRIEETETIDVVEVEVTLRLPVDEMTFGGGESFWKTAAVDAGGGREIERLKKMNDLLERWTRQAISASAFSPQFVQFLKVNGKVMNTDVEGEEVGGKKEENKSEKKQAREKEEKGNGKREKQKHEEDEDREKEGEDWGSSDEKVRGKLLSRSIVSEGFHRRIITQVVLGSPLPSVDLCQRSEVNSCTTTTTTGIGSEGYSSSKVDDATLPFFEKSTLRGDEFFSESRSPFFPSSPFPPSYCAILLVDFLPSTIFVDPDELRLTNVFSVGRSEEGGIGENIVVRLPEMSRLISPLPGEVDIEAPSFLSSPLLVQHLHPLPFGLPTFDDSGSNISALHLFFDLPIHLRYQSPCDDANEYERNCSSGYASVSLAPPLLFHNCTSSPDYSSRGGNNNNSSSSENNSIKSESFIGNSSSRTTISIDKDMNSKWKRLPVDVYRFGIKCSSDAFLCFSSSSGTTNDSNSDDSPSSGYSTLPLPLSSDFCDGKDIHWWWPPEDVYLKTEDEGLLASRDEDGFFYSLFPYIDAHTSAFATWSLPVGNSRHLMGIVVMSSVVGAVACGVTILLLCV